MSAEDRELPVKPYQFKNVSMFQEEETAFSCRADQSSISDSMVDRDTMTYLPAIVNQDTMTIPMSRKASQPQKTSQNFFQSAVIMIFSRVKEPEPEKWSNTLRHRALRLQNRPLGWLAWLMVTISLGVFLTAYACVSSIHTVSDQENYLWLGLLVIFAPSFLRLVMPVTSRLERIGLLCYVGFSIYVIPIILSPLHFFFVDEYMHLRTIDDIVRTAHLFTVNSMLPVSPLYPGMEIVTSAFSFISGLSPFISGLVVTGMSRVICMLALFMLFEQVAKSSRTASIGAMIYMANAGFFMFDSLFVYESLGLAIGIFMLFALYRSGTVAKGQRGLLFVSSISLGALTATHHVSDIFFIGILILWTLIQKFVRQSLLKSNIIKITFIGLLLTSVWIFVIAQPVIGYLSAPILGTLSQLKGVLIGSNQARHLFIDHTGGHPTPLWNQLVMLASIGFVTLSIPFAFLCLWHRYRYKPFPLVLTLVSLLYPLTQAMRLASESANIADRSSPFIFIAVSFALATFIAQMWPIQKLNWMQTFVITIIVTLIFLGGNMLGAGPTWRLMPSGYIIGDDARSIDQESIQAALWFPSYLGSDNRVYANSTNALLMNSYGNQHTVSIPADNVDVAPVFYAPEYHSWETSILQRGNVRYLIVDMRMSTMLPAKGYYFEGQEEPDINITTPISQQALTKFDTVPQMNRLFDSGNIIIYDAGELINASKES